MKRTTKKSTSATPNQLLSGDITVANKLTATLASNYKHCALRAGSGNIGGNMGLFFGASIITVAELAIYISKIIYGKKEEERDGAKTSA
uniref:Uncharacterized protein n=1 Tax=Parascaris equorum TaxID=6256 RepID=A0A914S196_PAREQ